jgi:hypothetical protein
MVIRAVVKDGTLIPLQPLPNEWQDGDEIEVELHNGSVSPKRKAEIAAWLARINSDGGMDAADLARFQAAVEEERRLGKEFCE